MCAWVTVYCAVVEWTALQASALFSWLIMLFEVSVSLLIFGQVGHILPAFVYVGLKATPVYTENVFYGGCVGSSSVNLISEGTGN